MALLLLLSHLSFAFFVLCMSQLYYLLSGETRFRSHSAVIRICSFLAFVIIHTFPSRVHILPITAE